MGNLLKLYKSVLVTPNALIAQAIFHSQVYCFQLPGGANTGFGNRFLAANTLTILYWRSRGLPLKYRRHDPHGEPFWESGFSGNSGRVRGFLPPLLGMVNAVRHPARGFADHQFRLDHDLAASRIRSWVPNAAQQSLAGNPAHLAQGLPHRGQRRILVGSALDVVESHYGDVIWNPQLRFAQRANRAHR